MRRRVCTLLASAILLTAPGNAQSQRGIPFTDLTDDFAAIYDRGAAIPEKERLSRFKADFSKLIPGFYSAARATGGDEAKYDELLLKALAAYPQQRASIARVSSQFSEAMRKAQVTFGRQFGAFPADQPVYLLHSLGEMDGGTRTLNGKNALIFGADVIARVHANNDLAPFFHHELFHVYHKREVDFRRCNQVWCGLWGEGLAVYVAQRLNPQATDSELLLTRPEPIRPMIEAHRTEAICTTIEKLDSSSGDDFRAMFSSGRLGPNLPPRFGYYVGYLVARDLGRTHSLKQLAKLQGPPLRALIGKSLARMASCLAKPQ